MKYLWNDSLRKSYPPLTEDLACDILIIGGGISGYLTAFALAQAGRKSVLVEANELFCQTTGHTTAFISAHQGAIYQHISEVHGLEWARGYYDSQIYGLKQYEKLVEDYHIDCHFRIVPSYIFHQSDATKLKKEKEVLKQLGKETALIDGSDRPYPMKYLLAYEDQMGQFDPLMFLFSLPVGFDIYEKTKVLKVDVSTNTVYTNRSIIKAKKIIVTTRYPLVDIPHLYFTKLYQMRSYLVGFHNAEPVKGLFTEEVDGGFYFRDSDDRLIVGAYDHRSGYTEESNPYEGITKTIQTFFPAAKVAQYVSAEDVMTFDHMPLVGALTKSNDSIYIVTGFNEWGMASAMVSSHIIRDAILGTEHPYAKYLDSLRPYTLPQLGATSINMLDNAIALGKQLLSLPCMDVKKLPIGEGGIVRSGLHKYAAFRVSETEVHAFSTRCQHLSCEVTWNPNDCCFECPCHGSRFDINGQVIDGPSPYPLESKEIDPR